MQIKKEPHGRRHRVHVVMDEGGRDGERISASNVPDGREGVLANRFPNDVSLAVVQEQVRGLEEMVEVLKEQLELERERYAGLVNDLRTGRLLEPRDARQHSWWRFWEGRS